MEMERAAGRRAAISRMRSRRFAKRIRKIPRISLASYGRETTVKLSTIKDESSGALSGRLSTMLPLVSLLQASNDWANYAASFQLFNITSVKVQILPGSTALGTTSAPNLNSIGFCYSTKDSTSITNMNQLSDHTNFTIIGTSGVDTSMKHFFKFRIRPKIKPPQSTADSTENFGFLKGYSDAFSTSIFVCRLIITFTCTFSAES